MLGRKRKDESRSVEFRQKLIRWKQSPESMRPSLRALAAELGTSHQLLQHYLDGLETWQWKQRQRATTEEAQRIRACAESEGRPLTEWEKQRVRQLDWSAARALIVTSILQQIERLRLKAQSGPLHRTEIKILRICGKQGFPEALEIARTARPKQKKQFATIVKGSPRQAGETAKENSPVW
jgi:hypothetical protein